jgi:hypothetical protein
MANVMNGIEEGREILRNQRVVEVGDVPRQRSDAEHRAVDLDRIERQPVDVNEVARPGQTEVHHWHQTLPACDRAAVVSKLMKEFKSMIERCGSMVLE